ncbi:hypothetical protein CKO15_11930 [Halorhodospira abdelmalekii]|nr:hypothetical protein [Halorhodospira abdelmalekii]
MTPLSPNAAESRPWFRFRFVWQGIHLPQSRTTVEKKNSLVLVLAPRRSAYHDTRGFVERSSAPNPARAPGAIIVWPTLIKNAGEDAGAPRNQRSQKMPARTPALPGTSEPKECRRGRQHSQPATAALRYMAGLWTNE